GLRSVFQTALRGLSNRSIVVVGNYEFGPITSEPSRAKARPLRPRRSYFAPTEARLRLRAWGEAPGTAPGSDGFIATPIHRHSRLAPASPIYAGKVDEKRARCGLPGVVWRRERPDSRGAPGRRGDAAIPRLDGAGPRPRYAQARPDRHRDAFSVRTPDAV